jgi:hypothetical protein
VAWGGVEWRADGTNMSQHKHPFFYSTNSYSIQQLAYSSVNIIVIDIQ